MTVTRGWVLLAAALCCFGARPAQAAEATTALIKARAGVLEFDAQQIRTACGPDVKMDPLALVGSEGELKVDICFLLAQRAASDLHRLTRALALPADGDGGSEPAQLEEVRQGALTAARSLFKDAFDARSVDGGALERPDLAWTVVEFWLVAEPYGFGRTEAADVSTRLCSDTCMISFWGERSPREALPREPWAHGDTVDALFREAAIRLGLEELRPTLGMTAQTQAALAALEAIPFEREVLNDAVLDWTAARAISVRLKATHYCVPTSLCGRLIAAEGDMQLQAQSRLP